MAFALRFFDAAEGAEPAKHGVTAILPASARRFFRDRIMEIGAIALAAVTGAALLALFSYTPGDSSLNSATAGPTANWLGPLGAVAADIFMQVIGLAAYLPFVGLIAWAWRLWRKTPVGHPGWRAAALILSAVAAGIALSAAPTPSDWPLATRMGGVAGTLVFDRAVGLIAAAGWPGGGPYLAGLAGFLAAVLWTFGVGLSWREWRASGLAIGAGAMFLGRGVKKGRDAFGVVPAWGQRWTGRGETGDEDGALDENEAAEPVADEIQVRVAVGAEDDAGEAAPPSRTGLVAPRKPKPKTGRKAKAARQGKLKLEPVDEYTAPPLELLEMPVTQPGRDAVNKDTLEQNAKFLATVLQDFGVKGEIVKGRPGPVVTLYELEPAPGTKTSRVIGLSDDIARSMSAVSVRVAVVPGRNVIGIELPNVDREMVFLRELLASADFERSKAKLPLAMGKDIGGTPVAVDLARMPHLLIAGTTGSGKSVAMNTMILSLLYSLGRTNAS